MDMVSVDYIRTHGGHVDNPFTQVAWQIRAADQLPALLAAAFVGLELADLTTEALAEQDPDEGFPAYLTARVEAAEARDALSRAPSLTWPAVRAPQGRITVDDIVGSLATLAMLLAQALVTAAERSSDPADRIACLDAALHAGRLHEALR
jgi:hypothetical protein